MRRINHCNKFSKKTSKTWWLKSKINLSLIVQRMKLLILLETLTCLPRQTTAKASLGCKTPDFHTAVWTYAVGMSMTALMYRYKENCNPEAVLMANVCCRVSNHLLFFSSSRVVVKNTGMTPNTGTHSRVTLHKGCHPQIAKHKPSLCLRERSEIAVGFQFITWQTEKLPTTTHSQTWNCSPLNWVCSRVKHVHVAFAVFLCYQPHLRICPRPFGVVIIQYYADLTSSQFKLHRNPWTCNLLPCRHFSSV